jgi:hypothetical protein
MAARRVIPVWEGPPHDLLSVFVDPYPLDFVVDPSDLDTRLAFYRVPDENDAPTGALVGVEIDDFLNFRCWQAFAGFEDRWYGPKGEPLLIADYLHQLQNELRAAGRRQSVGSFG